jgi:hypothetical protein
VRSGRYWRGGRIEQAGRPGGRSGRTGRTNQTAEGADEKDEQVNEAGDVGENASKVGEMAEVRARVVERCEQGGRDGQGVRKLSRDVAKKIRGATT